MLLMKDGGCQSKVPLRHSTDVTALPLKSHATIARSLDASDTLYFPIAVPDIMPLISCRARLAPPPLVFYVACVLPTSMMNAKFDEVQWRHLYIENLENIDKVSQEIWSVVLRARVPSVAAL